MRTLVRKRWYVAPIILVAIFLFGYITMLLWNALLPALFHFPVITFWQAAGLLILARLLFGGKGHHGHWHGHWGNHMRDKWRNMTPEEREHFCKNLNYSRTHWGHHASTESPSDDEKKA